MTTINNIVLVYGTLRKGFGNHEALMKTAAPLGKGVASGFSMFDFGSFPFVVPNKSSKVVIEAYVVDEMTLKRLDYLEGYPTFYNRKEAKATLDSGDVVSGWVYYMDDNRNNAPRIPSGDWTQK